MRLAEFEVGGGQPLFLISGPCVIESDAFAVDVAGRLAEIIRSLGVSFRFEAAGPVLARAAVARRSDAAASSHAVEARS